MLKQTSALVARTTSRLVALFGALALCSSFASAASSARVGPTTREVIEFTRLLQPLNHNNDALQTQISPDGKRAFIVTRRGDIGSDKNLFEILLLDVSTRRLDAGEIREPERLLTIEGEHDSDDADPSLREARWVGNSTIVFRARLHDTPFQVYRLDVATRQLTQMTYEPLGLVEFAVSDDLAHIVYVAPVPNPAMPPGARSLVVGTHSFWSVHFGQESLLAQQRRYRYLTVEAGSRKPPQPLGDTFDESSGWPSASISPDGRWAVLPRYVPERQLAWATQYPQVADATTKFGPSARLDPLGYFSRPYSYVPRQFVAYRLADGQKTAVVDAPDDSLPGNQPRSDRLWQRNGTSLIIAGTYLPTAAGAPDSEKASRVIEYWPDSGKWVSIATLESRLTAAFPVAGSHDGFVAVDGTRRRRFERGDDGAWHEAKDANGSVGGEGWRLRVEEGLNTPPDIVAATAAGRSVRLTNLNPRFSAESWGTMRRYGWKDPKGRTWDGGLMVPAGFDPKARHALVVQTYGFSPTRFYLDGSNGYDGFTSGFAGRAFLRENILVLALPWGATTGAPEDEHGQIAAFAEGVRGAIDSLVAEGSVDRDKVGIMGWSATGERVLNLVTFTDTPIRAATLLDADANTLYSMTITYAAKDGILNRKENANEGRPFGSTLDRWIRNDPSLHTDCVNAALRIETYGPVVRNNWDIYSLLRRQYKPAEMIIIPEGSHALARPGERLLSMQGNVDWYRFWLKGEERAEPILPTETAAIVSEQYSRWRQMAELKRAADAKPPCMRTSGDGA